MPDPFEVKLRALIRVSDRVMRRRLDAILNELRQSMKLDDLERAITTGETSAINALIDAAAQRIGDLPAAAYTLSGRAITRQIMNLRGGGGPLEAGFEIASERAAAILSREKLRLIRNFTEQQRRATRRALVEGTRAGENPRQMARRFRDSIGLTQSQTEVVSNYRRELERSSLAATQRQLTTTRDDARLRSIADGNRPPLTAREIDAMTERYRAAMVKSRAEVIARTEALRAVHLGGHEAFRQAVDAGHVNAADVIRTWRTARDPRVRDFDTSETSHVVMEGQDRGLNEPFVSGQGALLMFPGDRSAPANDVINCRCVVVTRIRPGGISPAPRV